eukprot:gene12926-biopygen11031
MSRRRRGGTRATRLLVHPSGEGVIQSISVSVAHLPSSRSPPTARGGPLTHLMGDAAVKMVSRQHAPRYQQLLPGKRLHRTASVAPGFPRRDSSQHRPRPAPARGRRGRGSLEVRPPSRITGGAGRATTVGRPRSIYPVPAGERGSRPWTPRTELDSFKEVLEQVRHAMNSNWPAPAKPRRVLWLEGINSDVRAQEGAYSTATCNTVEQVTAGHGRGGVRHRVHDCRLEHNENNIQLAKGNMRTLTAGRGGGGARQLSHGAPPARRRCTSPHTRHKNTPQINVTREAPTKRSTEGLDKEPPG